MNPHDLLAQTYIGFEDLFNRASKLTKVGGFPPYNIVKLGEDDEYVIELCVAGYTKDDLKVTHDNQKLIIVGDKSVEYDESWYIFKGVSSRKFTKEFTLAEDVVIKGSSLNNGILKITLERVIPDAKKPKTISID
jgi:molecular chaperone IbpA